MAKSDAVKFSWLVQSQGNDCQGNGKKRFQVYSPDNYSPGCSRPFPSAILAAPGTALDEPSLRQLRSLGRTCQAVVKLRRSDQNAARLKIETERWERVREQMDSDRADALKSRQREDLAAPVWGALKKAERLEQFGGGKAARMAVDLPEEIENCPDPAHFDSKVLASLSVPELRRDIEELTKNPPQKKTPVQAALETLREMEAGLGIKTKIKDPSAQPPTKPRRRARKPAQCRPAKRATTRRVERAKPAQPDDVAAVYDRRQFPVHPAEPAQPDEKARPSPAPAAQLDPAPLAPDSGQPAAPGVVASRLRLESGLSTTTPPAGAEPAIKPNQT